MQLENIKTFCDKLANESPPNHVNSQVPGGVLNPGEARESEGIGNPGTSQRHQQQEGMISCANIFPEHTISICRVQLWRSSYSSWLALSIWLQLPVHRPLLPFVLSVLHATSLTPSRQSESQSQSAFGCRCGCGCGCGCLLHECQWSCCYTRKNVL